MPVSPMGRGRFSSPAALEKWGSFLPRNSRILSKSPGWLSRIIRQTPTSRPDQDVTFLVSESRVKEDGVERRPPPGPDAAAPSVPGARQRGAVLRQYPADQLVAGTVTGPLLCSGGDQLDQTLVKTADHLAPALDYGPPDHRFPVAVPQRPFRRPGGLPVAHPVLSQVPVDIRPPRPPGPP